MSLVGVGTVDLPGHVREGGFDHAAIHHSTSRLYVAHTANDCLDIIDCAAGRYSGSVGGLTGVAGALVSEEQQLVFTSNRGENTVGIFSAGHEAELVKIPVGIKPNGLSFDPERGLLLAANVGSPDIPGSFTLSIVDIYQRQVASSIRVDGRTRWTVFNAQRDEFFVNISEPAQIVVVDANRLDNLSRVFEIPAGGPHGLDLDMDADRLFCACDDAKLFAVDAGTGKILLQAELGGKPDVIFFNRQLKHLYVAIGDPGMIEVFETGHLAKIETVITERGAHTLAFDQQSNQVYAFAPLSHAAMIFQDQ